MALVDGDARAGHAAGEVKASLVAMTSGADAAQQSVIVGVLWPSLSEASGAAPWHWRGGQKRVGEMGGHLRRRSSRGRGGKTLGEMEWRSTPR